MALRLPADRDPARATDRDGQGLPADGEFRVDVVYAHDGVRVRPVGEVDLATIGRLRGRMNEAMAAGADRVVLDLRATTFFDSSGLHLVMHTDAWATRSGTEFVIIAGPRAVQRTFEVAGLSGRLSFADDTEPRSPRPGVDRPGPATRAHSL